MDNRIQEFRMPRYHEIPNVGLYLEQTIKYINSCLAPLGITVTASMVSNYVKKGYVDRPIKKQYYAEQIAYLLFLVLAKQTLSMENIAALFTLQKKTYPGEVAYDYFCQELEDRLAATFRPVPEPETVDAEMPFAKRTLRSVIIALSHMIYLNCCFQNMLEEME